MQGANYVVVDHIDVGGAVRAGVIMDANSTHDTLQNMNVTNVAYGYDLQGSQYNLLTGNYVHNLNMYVNTVGGLYDCGAEGFCLEAASNNNIAYNLVVDAEAQSNEYGTDGGGFEFWRSCSGDKIDNNIVLNSDGFIETGGEAGDVISNDQIYDNVSANNGGFSWVHNINGTNFGTNVSGLDVYNNTIYEPTAWTIAGFDGPVASGTFSFTNNLVYAPDSGAIFNEAAANNTNNFYQAWIPPTGSGETSGTINFVNAAGNNYQTASGAAAAYGAYAHGNTPGLPSSANGPVIADVATPTQLATANSIVLPFGAIAITDPNAYAVDTVTVSLTGVGHMAGGGGGTMNAAGTLYTAHGTPAIVAAGLRSLLFWPAASGGATQLSLIVQNAAGQSTSDTIAITSQTLRSTSATAFLYAPAQSVSIAAQSNETIVFPTTGFGADTITGFSLTKDIIQLPKAIAASFAAVQSDETASSGGTMMSFGASGSVFLSGIAPSALHATNFHLV